MFAGEADDVLNIPKASATSLVTRLSISKRQMLDSPWAEFSNKAVVSLERSSSEIIVGKKGGGETIVGKKKKEK